MLSALHSLLLWGSYYYLHFANEEIGTRRGSKSCPVSHCGRNDSDDIHINYLGTIDSFSTKTRRKDCFLCWKSCFTLLLTWSEVQCFSYSGSALGWELILDGKRFLKWNVLKWSNPRVFHGIHALWVVNICYLQKDSEARYFENVDLKVNLIFLLQNFSELPKMGYRMLCFITKNPYFVEHPLGFNSHGTHWGKYCLDDSIWFLKIFILTHVNVAHLLTHLNTFKRNFSVEKKKQFKSLLKTQQIKPQRENPEWHTQSIKGFRILIYLSRSTQDSLFLYFFPPLSLSSFHISSLSPMRSSWLFPL